MRKFILFGLVGMLLGVLMIGTSSGLCEEAQGLTESVAVAKVTYIVDGDTFYVSYISGGDDLPISIRPYLIDTPKVNQRPPKCYGPQAERYAWDMLFGRTVWLVHYHRILERSNRLLAFVFLDSQRSSLYQAIMVAQGFAKVDIRHPEEKKFKDKMLQLQNEASNASRGRWGACEID